MEKNGNCHYNCVCDILVIKLTYLDVSLFFLLSYRFSAPPEAFQAKSVDFWFSSPTKKERLYSDCLAYEAKKKHRKHASRPNSYTKQQKAERILFRLLQCPQRVPALSTQSQSVFDSELCSLRYEDEYSFNLTEMKHVTFCYHSAQELGRLA